MGHGNDSDGTVCPLCAVGCRLAPPASASSEERARGRSGPANPDGRLCAKGIRAFERVPGDDRLERPLLRRDGELEPVEWPTAEARIVDGLADVRRRHGPDAVAFLGAPNATNEENFLLGKLARLFGTNNVDNRARSCHLSTARALSSRLGWPASTNAVDDLVEADVILVIGANPAARQPVAFDRGIRPAVNGGATLVHVDPAGNETTRLADWHLPAGPGMDRLLLDCCCAAVLGHGHADEGFLSARTTGFDPLEASLRDRDWPTLASRAGIDWETIQRVGRLVGEADRVAAVVGTGIEHGEEPPTAADSLCNLLLLTGNVGRRGTGLHLFRGLTNEQGATDAGAVPHSLPGHRPVTDTAARARLEAEWDADLPASPGPSAPELLEAFGDEVHAALVVGENPAVSKRDGDWVDERLGSLDTLAVVELTHTDTTANADVVLPAATPFEKAGTTTSLDRLIQLRRPVHSPPPEVRSDLEILCSLGRSLVGDQFEYDGPAAVFEELTAVAPSYADVGLDEVATGGVRWPVERGPVLYRDRFETRDGRAPLVPAGPPPDPPEGDGLALVVGGRTSDRDPVESGGRVRIHPETAAEWGLEAGEPVVLSGGRVAAHATLETDQAVRRGAVSAHATLADPLVRAGVRDVTVEHREE